MTITLYIRQAVSSIRNHLLRSFLTLLGVLVGTAAVVALLTGSELATQSALSQFKRLGTDLLALSLSESDSTQSQSNSLEQFKKVMSPSIVSSAPYTLHYSSVIYGNDKFDISTVGVTQELQSILKLQLEAGRFISNLDKSAFYCVLGNEYATSLTSNTRSLIGKQIRINNFYFTIIGVLNPADKNLFLFADTNQSIMIPIQTSLLLYKDSKIQNAIFKIQAEKKLKEAKDEIGKLIHINFPDMQFHFNSPETIIQNMENQNHIFKLLLGFIGGIALLVGGIGVMNIMLVSVTERRREIGIRMAVGARKKDILLLFLAEAAVLTLLGGIFGIFFGEIIGFIAAKFSHWEYHFVFTPVIIGFLVSVSVGIFFGYYPAQKASQSDPIEILRGA